MNPLHKQMQIIEGQVIHKIYQIIKLHSYGSQAIVYKGYDLQNKRYVVIQQYKYFSYLSSLSQAEIMYGYKVQQRIKLKSAVECYDMFREQDDFFIVLEFIDGITLTQFVKLQFNTDYLPLMQINFRQEYLNQIFHRSSVITKDKALKKQAFKAIKYEKIVRHIIKQLLNPLVSLYLLGLLHRDIKPDNVMIYIDNKGSLRAKLIDFGLVANRTTLNTPVGTKDFMPPEFRACTDAGIHKVIPHSGTDSWGLGAVLYYMLHLRSPPVEVFFSSNQYHSNIYNNGIPMNPSIGSTLREILNGALTCSPSNRLTVVQLENMLFDKTKDKQIMQQCKCNLIETIHEAEFEIQDTQQQFSHLMTDTQIFI